MVIKAYFPNPVFWGMGFFIPFILLYMVLIVKKAKFSFLLIIYILQHFNYAENQGGLWSLLTFALIAAYLFLTKDRKPPFFSEKQYMKWLFAVLIGMHLIGVFTKNPMPLLNRLQGTTTFLSYILTYFFVSRQVITKERLRNFFWICLILSGYTVIVSINQRYSFFYFDSPMFPLVMNIPGYTSTHSYGTIGSGPLLGEYMFALITFFTPFFLFKGAQKDLRVQTVWLALLAVLCCVNLVLTNSRATFILLFVMVFIYWIIQVAMARRLSFAAFGVTIVISIIFMGSPAFFGFDTLLERFYEIDVRTMSTAGIITGEYVNRLNVFPFALDRLANESWMVGHGYGTFDSNTIAWFGTLDTTIYDLHSLYFALPMIFGWLGAAAFILIVVSVFLRLLRTVWKSNNNQMPLYLRAAMIGFTIFWPLFLIDQYKVNVLAKINYQAIFWIWLGLSMALTRTAKLFGYTKAGTF
jgi:O-antigen ligase